MGRIQGEAFAAEIRDAVAFYEGLVPKKAGLGPSFNRLGPYIEASRKHVPELAEEVDGVAQGSGVDPEAVWFLNCMEELWPFEACTTIVADRWLMHAEQWYAGHSGIGVVVAQPDDGPAFVSPTCAGFLPAVGLNASGFAQGINSLTIIDAREGIPRLIVSRDALGARDLQDAVRAATRTHRAGGYAHVLATRDQRLTVETSATRSSILVEERAHTNHVLSWNLAGVVSGSTEGSRARLDRALKLLETTPPRSMEDCMALLADHDSKQQSICLHADGSPGAAATVFGMVCDLEKGRVAVSVGQPCSGEWEEHVVPGFVSAEVTYVG